MKEFKIFPTDLYNEVRHRDYVSKLESLIDTQSYETKKQVLNGDHPNVRSQKGSFGITHYHRRLYYNPKGKYI